jgi:hypothetical protein
MRLVQPQVLDSPLKASALVATLLVILMALPLATPLATPIVILIAIPMATPIRLWYCSSSSSFFYSFCFHSLLVELLRISYLLASFCTS